MIFKFLKIRKGLTKIELLAVITILAILVTLAVPQFLGYTRQAETIRLLNNGKIVESAVAQHYMANEVWPTSGQTEITTSVMALNGEMIHRNNPKISDKTFYTIDGEGIASRIRRTDTTRFVVDSGGIVYILNPNHIDTTGIQISTTSLLLRNGETADVNAKVIPANASIQGVVWESSNAEVASVSGDGTVTAYAAGQTTINAYTLNYRSHSGTVNVTVLPAPVATITMTPNTNINTDTDVLFTHNTTSSGVVIVGAEWQRNTDAITTTPPNGTFSAGAHTVRLRVQDAGGTWSEWTSVVFDVVPAPIATITMTPSANINTNTDVVFTRNTTSNGLAITSAEWQLNTGAITTTAPSGRFTAGTHTVRLRVLDANATWSEWMSVNFNVSAIPIASIEMTPQTNIITTTNVTFSHAASTSGEGTIVATEWQRNTDAITTTPPNGTFPAGAHTVRLRVRNSAGVWSEWATRIFSVTATQPIALITMTPATGIISTTNVVFNHTTSIPSEGTIIGAEWQRNSDAITTTPPNGTFPAGTHTVRLRVQNSAGTWSAWAVQSFNVAGLEFTSVSGGLNHSFALRNDGTVWAWGQNIWGQLGDGTTTNRRTPVRVLGLTNIIAIAGGGGHSLALRNDGTVWAWGLNGSGQLGNGTTTNSPNPVLINGLANVTAIATGGSHSLALRSDGTVWVWGQNMFGQLGIGHTTNRLAPVQVAGLTNITAISGGNIHSLVLRSNGTVWAWGNNSSGQLGNGTITNSLTPVQTLNLTSAIAISGGDSFSLALRNDGTVWAWGWDGFGQLGDGSITQSNRLGPGQVINLTSITAIGSESHHGLALRSNGTVWAWGRNDFGQLGDGTTADRPTPAQVLNLAIAITSNGNHSLALRSDGTIWAWGRNDLGQLGDGTTTNRHIPVRVLTP